MTDQSSQIGPTNRILSQFREIYCERFIKTVAHIPVNVLIIVQLGDSLYVYV